MRANPIGGRLLAALTQRLPPGWGSCHRQVTDGGYDPMILRKENRPEHARRASITRAQRGYHCAIGAASAPNRTVAVVPSPSLDANRSVALWSAAIS